VCNFIIRLNELKGVAAYFIFSLMNYEGMKWFLDGTLWIRS